MCHQTKLFWYFLDKHTNCGQEGTPNGKKNCASPLLPTQNLDRSVKINTFNEEVKNKEIMSQMCRCNNEDKNWSRSPTSTYIIDLAESIIRQEWISRSEDYIAHRSARYQWLVKYKGTDGEKICNSSIGWLDDNDGRYKCNRSTELSVINDHQSSHKFLKQFGLIPRFKRAYEITFNKDTSCLQCSCGKWHRTRIPCRHLASVIHDCEFLKEMYPNGFH